MPEGDTIFRAARTLQGVLAGKKVRRFFSPIPAVEQAARRLGVVGDRIARVEARGKHLLIHFAGGAVLHTHLRMTGSWHTYRRGTRWRQPAHLARAVVETPDAVAVCFQAPVCELLSADAAARHLGLAALGPDLLAAAFDPAVARRGLRSRPQLAIGEALVDQRALAGIGNVYKAEVLFLCGTDPFASVASLDDAALDRLVSTACAQLRRNLAGGRRRTTSRLAEAPLWVYGRRGRPCRRCGSPIEMRRQGALLRSTYYCPRCQRVPVPSPGARRGAR
jgi:endonuclease-8